MTVTELEERVREAAKASLGAVLERPSPDRSSGDRHVAELARTGTRAVLHARAGAWDQAAEALCVAAAEEARFTRRQGPWHALWRELFDALLKERGERSPK